ncbi:response regulator [Tautonia sociabilis]|uniref:Response regulator n=1 Tax=Tautonia sociabilis TaxID=2080755 RepID=A0A432MGC9_9BACT|nr:response regulator [Tautonia sociabilis]RUL85532.1 response regulator [Tautonia sociabilis]
MAPSEPISIVLADDDDDLRRVTAAALRAAGMIVREASDGEHALEQVRRHRPSALVLDLWMPRLDGLQVLDALRFDPAAGRLAVIVLTGDAEADGRLLALAAGAACVVLKGGAIAELISAIRSRAEQALGPPFGLDPDDDRPTAETPGPVGSHLPPGASFPR